MRKFLCFICLAVILLSCPVSSVSAESKSYDSGAGVGFTGEYVYPEPEPTKPPADVKGDQNNKPDHISPKTTGKSLSASIKTGDMTNIRVLLCALLVSAVILTGICLHQRKRKSRF